MKFPSTDCKKSRTTVLDNHLTKADGKTAHPMPIAVLQYSEGMSQCGVQSALAHMLGFCDQLGPGGRQLVSASLACDLGSCWEEQQ